MKAVLNKVQRTGIPIPLTEVAGDFLSHRYRQLAIGHGECLLGDDAFLSSITRLYVGIIKLHQEGILVIAGMQEIEAPSVRGLGIVSWDRWAKLGWVQSTSHKQNGIPDGLGLQSGRMPFPE